MSSPPAYSPAKRWLLSLRPYSFTASIMPVLLAAAVSARRDGERLWWTFPLYALSALLFHAGTNVLNDYYDYKHGVDGPDDEDPTHAITQGIASPRFMAITGHLYFVLGVLIGAPIALARGGWFLAAGILGALGAYFYTNARFSFKYVALGDLAVFLLMGPALVVMGVWALQGDLLLSDALHAIPMALLVTAILHGNNLRNIKSDSHAGIRTVAVILGRAKSVRFFDFLLLSPYVLLILFVLLDLAPWLAVLAILPVVPSVQLARRVHRAPDLSELMNLPMECAKLHLLFTGLYILGLLLPGIFG